MRYEMKLNNTPFEQMQKNEKTLEIRLNDAKRKLLNMGDEILFLNKDHPTKTLLKKVKDLRLYNCFAEMAENENCISAGFPTGYTTKDVLDCYYTFYTPEEEKQFGVLVIVLE